MNNPYHPEPPPQNDLEWLMQSAAQDPAQHGKLFRTLMASELFTYIPDHPEMHGNHELKNGDQFNFIEHHHADGPYVLVATSDEAADYLARNAPEPKPAVAAMPAEVLFKTFNDGKHWVRVNYGMKASFSFPPESVADLVNGDLTHSRPYEGEKERLTLGHWPAHEIPAKLRQAIRVFCVKRQGAKAIYAFHRLGPDGQPIDPHELFLMVVLRGNDPAFYNDLKLTARNSGPKWLSVAFSGVTDDAPDAIAFLQGRTPLWPVT
jgi:hypothetical protein